MTITIGAATGYMGILSALLTALYNFIAGLYDDTTTDDDTVEVPAGALDLEDGRSSGAAIELSTTGRPDDTAASPSDVGVGVQPSGKL